MSESKIKRTRKPIVLGANTVICVNVYRTTGSMLDEIFLQDSLDDQSEVDNAAQALVDAISDELSVAMIWSLREALARQIEACNREFGSAHPIDRPASTPSIATGGDK